MIALVAGGTLNWREMMIIRFNIVSKLIKTAHLFSSKFQYSCKGSILRNTQAGGEIKTDSSGFDIATSETRVHTDVHFVR